TSTSVEPRDDRGGRGGNSGHGADENGGHSGPG
ncbi:MAG: 30S ribosomal protein S5, partial [Pseudonocardiales bacterium]